jgi:3',5'-cyclic AMP phosphodiesterase CpdA
MKANWRQVRIIHLTDIHFGQHAFDPPIPADGSRGSSRGLPRLVESVMKDLAEGDLATRAGAASARASNAPAVRTIVAITGDTTQAATAEEFKQARDFLSNLYGATALGWRIRPQDIFIIPGNHDLVYSEQDSVGRWGRYCSFYGEHARRVADGTGSEPFRPTVEEPQSLTRLIDQSEDGLVVLEINSAADVRKGTPEEHRGMVDQKAMDDIDTALSRIEPKRLNNAIRIALIHHHPVVLPGLADPGEGYDAVVYSDFLLDLLKKYRFHVVLHGHKHQPYTFSYDAVCAWVRDELQPLMVVAGGSAGIEQLPDRPGKRNTYNILDIKWHPEGGQARIHVETRGLIRESEDNRPLLGPKWTWRTERIDDRLLVSTRSFAVSENKRARSSAIDDPFETKRQKAMEESHRNYPAIEIVPSLRPEQGYEARVWIESQPDKPEYEAPARVEWYAGPRFSDVKICERKNDPTFSARFSYYGPMLIQARLFWDKKKKPTLLYVFARFPGAR